MRKTNKHRSDAPIVSSNSWLVAPRIPIKTKEFIKRMTQDNKKSR